MAPRGAGATSGGALPKLRILCPKTAFFGPKRPQNRVITAKRRQRVPTLHMCLNWLVNKSPFLPSSSTICMRNGPKMAKNGLNMRYLCPTRPKPRTGRILGYVAQNQVPRAPIPPATPHLLWFPSLRTKWSLGGAGGQPGPRTVGANGGSTRVPGAKKIIFSEVVPRPLGMLKQVFLAHFEPVVTCFGP